MTVTYQMRDRWRDIEDGDVLAWSRHITGQSTTDMNDFDEFKSVAVIKGTSNKACGDTRYDDEVWVVVDRTIDGNDYTFVEQFQPLDWGDDADYCWFVDCGIADGNSYNDPGTPAVPGTNARDEYLFIATRYYWVWIDHDYADLDSEAVSGSAAGGSCDVDDDGNIIASSGVNDDGCYLTFFDSDNTAYTDLYTPSDNWGAGSKTWQAGLACRFDTDGSHVYCAGVNVSGYVRFYKFPVEGGAEDWIYEAVYLYPYAMYVDASDNVYMERHLTSNYCYIDIIDTDGSLTDSIEFNKVTTLSRDIWVDEDNSRVYACGQGYAGLSGGQGYCIGAADLDGTNINYFARSKGNLQWGYINYCVYKYGDYIYSCGERSAHGVGGANATVFKLDTSLNLIASYDTGASDTPQWIRANEDGNLIVMTTNASGANDGGVILDTDLNLVESWSITARTQGTYKREFVVIDSSVPGTDEIPGTDPNYYPFNLYENMEVCVYADGIPIGTRTVQADANGTLVLDVNDTYDVIIAGLNYYSIYESFPINLAYGAGWTSGFYSSIKDVKIDFYESMGCNVGVSIDDSVDWTFSYDDFATSIEPVTEIKTAPFIWGTTREPIIYLWIWKPIPATYRTIVPRVNVSMD